MTAIGVDVGATTTRIGLIDDAGDTASVSRSPTSPHVTGVELVAAIVGAAARMSGSSPGDTRVPIGIALPGILDPPRRRLLRAVNLPQLEGFPIAADVADQAGSITTCVTDAEAATWGEFSAAEPRPARFAHLRIGTGAACGLVIDGHMPDMAAGRTNHLEVLVVDTSDKARLCRCGRHGCLETVASGAALAQRSVEAGYSGGLDALQAAWQRAEPVAIEVINEARAGLDTALRNLHDHFGLDAICLGGGVVAHLPCLVDAVLADPPRPAGSGSAGRTMSCLPARLGDDAGVIGAALLAASALT